MRLPGNLDLEKGQLLNARAENLLALPAFVPTEDEGRLVFVTMGGDLGFWVGASDGTSAFQRFVAGGAIGVYSVVNETVANGVTADLTVAASGTGAARGNVSKVVVSSAATSGQVRVRVFEDVGLTSLAYDAYFDMQNPQEDRLQTFFELDNSSADMYISITNLTGAGNDFTVTITTTAVQPVTTPPPPGDGSGVHSGVAGEGVDFDSLNGRLDVDLGTNEGLQLTGSVGSKKLGIKFAAGGGLTDSGSGAQLDSAVGLVKGTDQASITGLKAFSQFGFQPGASPGAPVAGSHAKGEIFMDSVLDQWLCTVAGTPGTWVFYGWKESLAGGAADGSSYTATITAGSFVDLEIVTTGRRGWIRKLNIWGADPAYAASNILSHPVRVICYPNENKHGREQIWSTNAEIRKTYLTAPASGGAGSFTASSVGGTNLDDLIRMRKAVGPLEEYQRVTNRNTGTLVVDVDETLVNSFATNDNVMFVTEIIDAPWRNNSGVGAQSQKIFLRFRNDHPTDDVVVGYELLLEEIGGGLPI